MTRVATELMQTWSAIPTVPSCTTFAGPARSGTRSIGRIEARRIERGAHASLAHDEIPQASPPTFVTAQFSNC